MAYYDTYYNDIPAVRTPIVVEISSDHGTVQRRMLVILATVLFVIVPLLVSVRPTLSGDGSTLAEASDIRAAPGSVGADEGLTTNGNPSLTAGSGISPVFTPEVRYWAPQIARWSETYGVDANLVAIIMQIESCGDPEAVSSAGAQGLFQVMPFHFSAGEIAIDPETNARRGLSYFVERLNQTGGDVGRAFAGYNGGHVAAAGGWDDWVAETQRYFVWSTGIYEDIMAGQAQSTTIQEWLQAGGASLCRQAASRLGL